MNFLNADVTNVVTPFALINWTVIIKTLKSYGPYPVLKASCIFIPGT